MRLVWFVWLGGGGVVVVEEKGLKKSGRRGIGILVSSSVVSFIVSLMLACGETTA